MKTKEIKDSNGRLYAVVCDVNSKDDEGTVWLGNEHESLQIGVFKFNAGKDFKKHKHILRPRLVNYTQEVITVFSGKLHVEIWSNDNMFLWEGQLITGQMIVTYRGYHYYHVLTDDTKFVETKNGPFYCDVADDKHIVNND